MSKSSKSVYVRVFHNLELSCSSLCGSSERQLERTPAGMNKVYCCCNQANDANICNNELESADFDSYSL